jgi:hypothetical protein
MVARKLTGREARLALARILASDVFKLPQEVGEYGEFG